MNIGAEVRTQFSVEEEDDLLQFAIQQSLLEAGSERDEVSFFFFVFYTIVILYNFQNFHVSIIYKSLDIEIDI